MIDHKETPTEYSFRRATSKAKQREQFLFGIRLRLRKWAKAAADLEPFDNGTFIDQLRFEVNLMRAEMGDELVLRRKARKADLSGRQRRRCFERDDFACLKCGWQSPDPAGELKPRNNRPGRFLTVDHVVPVADGGTNRFENLQTMCSDCNNTKGRALPIREATRG